MKGKIVLVPFPFDDFTASKVRPALCLTEAIGKHKHVIIAFITSRVPEDKNNSDVELSAGKQTGLKVVSWIRLHKVVTIPQTLIKRELGKLNSTYTPIVNDKLKLLLKIK